MRLAAAALLAASGLACASAPRGPAAVPAAASPAAAAAAPAPVASPVASPPTGWTAVDAKDAGFTAWFPGEPEHFAERKAGVAFVGYGFDSKDEPRRSFVVLVLGGSDVAPFVADQLVAEGFAGGAQPRSDEATTVDGHPARAILVEGEDAVIALRRFAAFGREHVALVRVPAGAAIPPEAETFFGSLRIRETAELPPAPAAAASRAAAATEGFRERTLPEAAVALAFPAEPRREVVEPERITRWTVEGAEGRATFSLTTMTFAAGAPLSDDALVLFALQVADAYGEGVIRNEPATVGGLPGRALTVADGDGRVEVRLVRAGNRLHHLLVSAAAAAPAEADLQAFFGSFRALQ